VSEAQAAALEPDEAGGWIGCTVDDVAGEPIGSAHGLFVDAASREPTWLVLRLKRSRFASPVHVVVPAADCAGGGGRVWVAHPRRSVLGSPVVDPRRPLLREHELAICAHYGIGQRVGRAAAVADRAAGAITSQPA
jgi:hypothetical protein